LELIPGIEGAGRKASLPRHEKNQHLHYLYNFLYMFVMKRNQVNMFSHIILRFVSGYLFLSCFSLYSYQASWETPSNNNTKASTTSTSGYNASWETSSPDIPPSTHNTSTTNNQSNTSSNLTSQNGYSQGYPSSPSMAEVGQNERQKQSRTYSKTVLKEQKKIGSELYSEYGSAMHRLRLQNELTPAQWRTTLLFHRVRLPLTADDYRSLELVLGEK
jgi:hypothetical protein